MNDALSPQISSSSHPLPQALLPGWGNAVVLRVFFRTLLFFPSTLSLRMVHILPHTAPSIHQHAVPMGAISPALGTSQPLLQKLLMAAVQGNPVFFQEKKGRGAQGQRGVSAVRVGTFCLHLSEWALAPPAVRAHISAGFWAWLCAGLCSLLSCSP